MVLDVKLLPRGSGNRAAAERLARQFEADERFAPHIIEVNAGASRVTVHFRCSLALIRAIQEAKIEVRDVPGQLGLFNGAEVA